jgi:hypothetical protein
VLNIPRSALTAPATQAGDEMPSENASLPEATTGTTPAARALVCHGGTL